MEEKVKGKKMPIDLNPNMSGVNQTLESQPPAGTPTSQPDAATANAFQNLLKDPKQEGGSSSQSGGDQSHTFVANPFAKAAQGGATSAGATSEQANTSAAAPSTAGASTAKESGGATSSSATGGAEFAKPAQGGATSAGASANAPSTASTSTVIPSKESGRTTAIGEKSSDLTGEQLSQLAQGQSIPQAINTGAPTAPTEASNTPVIDGEKIQALVDSVVKELAVRDLSSIRLTGELSIPLDPSILPDTALKVRFEDDTMVVSIDSKSKDVNGFCRDNLDSLQNALASSAPEGAQVRVEIRADQQTAQASQGNASSQDNQSGQSEGRQQAEDERRRQHQAFEPKA